MSDACEDTEEVVFTEEANIIEFRNGNPAGVVGKWYIWRRGYYINDELTAPRTFYLRRDGRLWCTSAQGCLFDSEDDARSALATAGTDAVARPWH